MGRSSTTGEPGRARSTRCYVARSTHPDTCPEARFALAANPDVEVDRPDNITISPYGGVILAEDGRGTQHIVGATDAGETFFFALNELNGSEFAGPTFSQNKKTLFVNIYNPGNVFAVTGPWRKH